MPRQRTPSRADSGTAPRTQPQHACCPRMTSPTSAFTNKHASPPVALARTPPHPACRFTSDPHRNAEVARFLALRNGLLPTHSHHAIADGGVPPEAAGYGLAGAGG